MIEGMNAYVFSSKNLTNIWAGIGAARWAVSDKAAALPNVVAASRRVPVGSLGFFYCTEVKGFTTPFLITSKPDQSETVSNIWPEKWHLPFSIHSFGNPSLVMPTDYALTIMPSMKKAGRSHWTAVIHIQATLAFQPTTLDDEDWSRIISELVPQ
jgi:hypothetical protein